MQLERLSAQSTAGTVAVFSAWGGKQVDDEAYVTYDQQHDMGAAAVHGRFDKDTGLFAVKTRGLYLVLFNGLARVRSSAPNTVVSIRVNGLDRAPSGLHIGSEINSCVMPLVISTLVQLNSGDELGVFVNAGQLSDSPSSDDSGKSARFSAILLQQGPH